MIEIENTEGKYRNGTKWMSNSYGEYEIIKKFDTGTKHSCYECKFNDGTTVTAVDSSVHSKSVKNPNKPTVFGLGFIGQGKWSSSVNNIPVKEYNLWYGMFTRCYSEKFHKKRPHYKDCEVDKRWRSLQIFAKDIQELENYDEWKNSKIVGAWQLDKDIRVKGNKIYSKDTCKFATRKEQGASENKRQTLTGKTYIGTRILDGYEEEFINQTQFAKKYNLNIGNLVSCIHGRRNKTGGWTFKIKEEI